MNKEGKGENNKGLDRCPCKQTRDRLYIQPRGKYRDHGKCLGATACVCLKCFDPKQTIATVSAHWY